MKKLITSAIIVMTALLVSCGESPKSTAKAFSENLAKGKISEAKNYATEGTGQLLDSFAQFGGFEPQSDVAFIIVEEKIDGDKATVKIKETKSDKTETLNLVMVDGKWKVHMKK